MNPAPTAASRTRSPFFSLPVSTAVCMASGMVPAVVLPKRSMLMTTFSGGIFSRSAVAAMMRRLAWWAMKQSTSAPVLPFFRQHALGHLGHLLYGVLEDLLAVLMDVVHLLVDGLVRCGIQAAAAGHVEVLAAGAFDLGDVVDDAVFAGLRPARARPLRRRRRR